ncbi:MAG: type VI secretion system membrane subunit TssM, partial [Geminicoccaceae bacterium]
LGSATSAAYQRVLQSALLPRLINRLEQQIKDSLDQPERLSEALKIYLMLEDPTRFDRVAVGRWYGMDVDRWLPGNASIDRRIALQSHLAALFEQQLVPPLPDENLVGQARQVLGASSIVERAYARIRGAAKHNAKPWTLRKSLGEAADRVFDQASLQAVPGFFTIDAYRTVFPGQSLPVVKELIDDAWVVGIREVDEEGRAAAYQAMHDEVVALYLADYVDQWENLLRGIRLIQPRDLRQVSRILDDLIGDDAVLSGFFEEISRQTKLSRPDDADADPTDTATLAKEAAEKLDDRLAALPANITDTGVTSARRDLGLSVEQRFARIHALVDPGDDGQSRIERVTASLERFGRHVATISGNDRSRRDAGPDDISLDIALLAERQVEPLRTWIIQITSQVKSLSGQLTQTLINKRWQGRLASVCGDVLTSHYPFDATSRTDLRLADFTRFFAPNGLLDAFFKENLEGLVDTSSRPWKARAAGNSGIRITSGAIRTFEQAALIRDTFFQNGGPPAYSFVLSPVSLDSAVSKFQLELGDQRIAYRHGPVRARELTWPGSNAIAGARLVFTTFEQAAPPASLSARGVWGWFRLLDRFQSRSDTSATSDLIDFEIDGFKATYALDPMTSKDVAVLSLFDDFRCPTGF